MGPGIGGEAEKVSAGPTEFDQPASDPDSGLPLTHQLWHSENYLSVVTSHAARRQQNSVWLVSNASASMNILNAKLAMFRSIFCAVAFPMRWNSSPASQTLRWNDADPARRMPRRNIEMPFFNSPGPR